MPTIRSAFTTVVIIATFAALASCGNTIRGVGKDTASAVHATKSAGRDVERAAR